jgi:cytochrome c oxidase cbb3-type subunit I/II
MVRPFVAEVRRYGDYSRLGESIYDHPYQWGSRRIGPDLARVGGKYPNIWHYAHMRDPRAISPKSNMPNYAWLLEKPTDYASLPARIRAQKILGTPFPDESPAQIDARAKEQARAIAATLEADEPDVDPDAQIVALIAYLQQLGQSDPSDPRMARAR